MSRRINFLNKERKKDPEKFLLLDAGNLFFSKSKSSCDQKELGKADAILKSYQTMGYDAINLSQTDLSLGVPFLLEKAKDMKLPFVSSNLIESENGKSLFNPFIIKKIYGNSDHTVGIFGLMNKPQSIRDKKGYSVRDPYSAAREVIGYLKGKTNLIMALSSLSQDMNNKLLEECPEIDLIISTDKRLRPPTGAKNGYILSSGDRGRYVGRLSVKLSSLKRPLRLKDMSRKKRLKENLTWTQNKISKLEDERKKISASDNTKVMERFNKGIERLKNQQKQYHKELADLVEAGNYFENITIPLASAQPKKITREMLSPSARDNVAVKGAILSGRADSPIRIQRFFSDEGKKLTFVIHIDRAPNEVRALGFDALYDPKILRYSNYAKSELVNKFDMFDASKIKEGLVRIGGFEARGDLIMTGKSGELIKLIFDVIGKGNSKLHLVRLKDDISSWGVKSKTDSYADAQDKVLLPELCISDADCPEGYSCWHEMPRGPKAGIKGSKDKPGKCQPDEVVKKMY